MLDELKWEVIVVDNNSTDDTKTTACRLMDHLPIRYMFETNQGLSHARNRAIKECRGDFLIFTDDDIIIDTNWLYKYNQAARIYSEAEYFGGKIIPLWNGARPKWLKDSNISLISGLIGSYDLEEQTVFIMKKICIHLEVILLYAVVCLKNLNHSESIWEFVEAYPAEEKKQNIFKELLLMVLLVFMCQRLFATTVSIPVHLNLNYIYRYGIQKGIAEVRMDRAIGTIIGVLL